MPNAEPTHAAVAIVPSVDLDESERFYARLGFERQSDFPLHGYRILADAGGAGVHLTRVAAGAIDPATTAYGIYLYSADVAALAARLGVAPETRPWGLVEFAVSDPSGTLVRVGWPG